MLDNEIRSGKYDLSIVHYTIIIFYGITPFIYFLRPLEEISVIAKISLRILEPLLIMITSAAIYIKILNEKSFKVDWYFSIMILMTFYAFLIGLIMGNEIRYVLSGISHILAGLLTYWFFKHYYHNEQLIKKFINKVIIVSLIANSFAIGFMYLSNKILGTSYYIGLDSSVLLLGLFWALNNKNLLNILLFLGLIFISGKRGVLVSGILTMGIAFLTSPVYRLGITMRLFFIGFVSLMAVPLLGIDLLEIQSVKKIFQFTDFDLNYYSAGRIEEIFSAFIDWAKKPIEILVGSGLGFSFTYVYFDSNMTVPDSHNVHFSPMNILIIWGFPISIMIYCLFMYLIYSVMGTLKGINGTIRLTVISLFIYSMFVFNIFNEPLLWALIGILASGNYEDSYTEMIKNKE